MAQCRQNLGGLAAGCVATIVVGTALGTLISGFVFSAPPTPGEGCFRTCTDGDAKTCSFDMTVYHYQTLSRACGDCPANLSHCSLPDCIVGNGIKRFITVADRILPGTAIHVCKGDTVLATVRNALPTSGVSLHWHGLTTDAFMDGAASLTKSLIGPQQQFQYTFKAKEAGTYFWHSAAGFEGGDGLFGPLVVRQPHSHDPNSNLYDYDLKEHTILVNDWLHVPTAETYVLHHHSGSDHYPSDLLVNGKGTYTGEGSNKISKQAPEAVFLVKSARKRYRFRLISAAFTNCPIVFSISKHLLTVIASDGNPIVPYNATQIVIQPGERWDFVLTTSQDPSSKYYIHFQGLKDCSVSEVSQRAILEYGSFYDPVRDFDKPGMPQSPIDGKYEGPDQTINPVNADCSSGYSSETCLSQLLSALPAPAFLKNSADTSLYFEFNLRYLNNPLYYNSHYHVMSGEGPSVMDVPSPQINNLTLTSFPASLLPFLPPSKSLESCNFDNRQSHCSHQFCDCVHVHQVELGAVVDLILVEAGGDTNQGQSVHLHGHSFYVLGHGPLPSGMKTASRQLMMDLYEEGLLSSNSENPIIKDTISLPKGGYALVRFKADNPGYWPLHSQFLFHWASGMSVILKVGQDSDLPSPPDGVSVCS